MRALLTAVALVATAGAQATTVTAFAPSFSGAGVWYQSELTAGGTIGITSLVGAGGKLENDQPLPTGAAKLTTDNTNAARAGVSVSDSYGAAGDILRSLNLHYDFYRTTTAGTNLAAAPSLKLTFSNPSAPGDNFVTLIYEAYWQGANPDSNEWLSADIDFDSGLFWQNGGFGQANSSGGPPLNTLQGWLSTFNNDFSAAQLLTVSVGIGTFNPGIDSYFDNVRISHSFDNGYNAAYDFEALADNTVAEPGSLALAGMALFGLATLRRRSRGG